MDRDERHKSAVEKLDAMFSEVLQVRNALCHGQISATGDASKNKALVRTELSGKKADYHYSDLVTTIDKIHCVQMALLDISSLASDLDDHSVDLVFKNIQGHFGRVENS